VFALVFALLSLLFKLLDAALEGFPVLASLPSPPPPHAARRSALSNAAAAPW